jgi:hypothetical protein
VGRRFLLQPAAAIFVLFLIIYFAIRSINAGQNASFDKGDVILVRDNPLVFSE